MEDFDLGEGIDQMDGDEYDELDMAAMGAPLGQLPPGAIAAAVDQEDDDEELSEGGPPNGPQVDDMEDNEMLSWIQWFCALEGQEFLVEVDPEFVKENLHGLQKKLNTKRFKECVKLILSNEPSQESLQEPTFLELNQEASDLYGLIHARFIHTARGMAKMY